jgi:hypothetical protein
MGKRPCVEAEGGAGLPLAFFPVCRLLHWVQSRLVEPKPEPLSCIVGVAFGVVAGIIGAPSLALGVGWAIYAMFYETISRDQVHDWRMAAIFLGIAFVCIFACVRWILPATNRTR